MILAKNKRELCEIGAARIQYPPCSGLCLSHLDIASAREEIAILVERNGHHTVRDVECFFDSISVVDVNINVQHTRVVLEQLQDTKHDVVHVAKPGSFGFLRVVQAARPIDRDVTETMVQSRCRIYRYEKINPLL